MSRAASHLTTKAGARPRRRRRSLLAIAIGFVIAVLAVAPAAFADTGTPINGSINLTYQVDPATGAVTVYAQGQWNWPTHSSDCNTDRAGAGVSLIWNDPNEPGYTLTGKDVHGNNISYGVGVAQRTNGDTYNAIDGTVHPADLGLQGGAGSSMPGLPSQVFHDVAPLPSGSAQDVQHWRGGCGREPLDVTATIVGTVTHTSGASGSTTIPVASTAGMAVNDHVTIAGNSNSALNTNSYQITALTATTITAKGGPGGPTISGTGGTADDVDATSRDQADQKANPTKDDAGVGCAHYCGIPWGSWGYNQAFNNGLGYAHTYVHASDISTVCVNMYDVHGGDHVGGNNFQLPAGSNEIDAAKAGDNTIKAGQFDPQGLNCVTPGPADLSISKSDGVTSVVPGTSTTYTIVVTNTGGKPAVNQTVTDNLPSTVTGDSWTASASAGSSVAAAGGSGNINTTVNVLPGGTVTFTVAASVSASATGTLSNTASVTVPTGDPTPANNTSTDIDNLTPQGALSISKTDNTDNVTSGGTTTYTVVVTNSGPSQVQASVTDPVPTGLTFTPVNDTITLAPGGTQSYTIVATVTAPSGSVTNTATVSSAADPSGPHNASDTDTVTPAGPQLSITKDDGLGALNLGIGQDHTTYTITVSNAPGAATAVGATVADAMPSNVTAMSWSSSTGASGTGSFSVPVTIPGGASVTFTVTVTGVFEDSTVCATEFGGTLPCLVNTASVTYPDGITTLNASDSDFLIGL
jgi:uncharacterized repeat protein (TIGR01451 family)